MRVRREALLVAAAVLLQLAGCARSASDDISVSGQTRVDLVTVSAPRLDSPTADTAVGIARQQPPDARDRSGASALSVMMKASSYRAHNVAAAAAAAARRPSVAGTLGTVTVQPGDVVRKGQVLARFDDRLLKLAVGNAEAAERAAAAKGDVLASQVADLHNLRASVGRKGRARLAAGQSQLDSKRFELQAKLAAAIQAKAALPRLLQVPHPTPEQRQAVSLAMALPQLRAAGRQLDAAQSRIDAGREKLESALAKMTDGIRQLESACEVARAAAGIPAVGVHAAKAALDQATIIAPCDGVVMRAMQAGEVAIVGAPVVTIRPTGPTLVDTYLEPGQAACVKAGASADIALDSLPEVHGRVWTVSSRLESPPSNYPTQIVHLSRVVHVTVSVPETLPIGVPVDVVIHSPPQS